MPGKAQARNQKLMAFFLKLPHGIFNLLIADLQRLEGVFVRTRALLFSRLLILRVAWLASRLFFSR